MFKGQEYILMNPMEYKRNRISCFGIKDNIRFYEDHHWYEICVPLQTSYVHCGDNVFAMTDKFSSGNVNVINKTMIQVENHLLVSLFYTFTVKWALLKGFNINILTVKKTEFDILA